MTERFREISRNRPDCSIVPPSEAADLIALPPLALSLPPFGASDRSPHPDSARFRIDVRDPRRLRQPRRAVGSSACGE